MNYKPLSGMDNRTLIQLDHCFARIGSGYLERNIYDIAQLAR